MNGCNHNYGKWGVPFNSIEVRDSGSFGKTVSVDVVVQERICRKCKSVDAQRVREGRLNQRQS